MQRLKLSTKVGYGFGDLASNLIFQLTVIYLLFFYTDVLGIPAISAGMIFLIARLWDAINDPIMGLLMDKTKSRHGKARVYLLWASLPLAVITILMFFSPDFSINGKIIYAAVTYILWGMLYTMVNIPYSSLTASLTNRPEERTSLSSIRMIFMLIGVIIVSVVTEPLVSSFETMAEGYFYVAIIFGIMSYILFLLCFKLTKVATKKQRLDNEKYKAKDILPLLICNKQLVIVTLASLIGNMAIFIRETSAIYYVTYNIGDSNMLPFFLGVVVLSMLISNLLIPFATKIWDKKRTYISGSIIAILGSVIFHFIPFDRIGLILIFAGISSFGIAAISTVGWSMIPDTIEYGQWKTGIRAEGVAYAVYSFSQKLATAVAGILVAGILKWTGYVAGSATQSLLTQQGILATLTVIPIILIIISIIFILPYKIDRKLFRKIINELQKTISDNSGN